MSPRLSLLAILSATLVWSAAVRGAAPQHKTQAPGFYRMMLGDFEVTALSDGTFPLEMSKTLTRITPERMNAMLGRAFLHDPVEMSVNGFLINTGAKLVLVDTGTGALMGPSLGKLLGNLKASGYEPGQVDEVYITHMHGDHIGGLSGDGKAVFPNAVVRAAKAEADHWLSKDRMNAAPKEAQGGFQTAMTAFAPYLAAGRFKPFDGDVELVPGIRALATPGHTPGHTVYVVASQGSTLELWGDLMHVAAVQFMDPAVTVGFDSDSDAATAQRKRVFADAAAHGYWVAAAHLSFPGIGHIRPSASTYSFVPANYSSLR